MKIFKAGEASGFVRPAGSHSSLERKESCRSLSEPAFGDGQLLVSAPSEWKRKFAKDFGADDVLDAKDAELANIIANALTELS